MVTIHRHTIVTWTDIILKLFQIWVSVVSYCHKEQTYYCYTDAILSLEQTIGLYYLNSIMSNIHLKYRIYTYYLNFELFKYGFLLYHIATRNRHIIVALHRCNIVTRTDNCTALFQYFF